MFCKFGYECKNGVYCYFDCKVIFVGDYIDCGLDSLEVVDIVWGMVDVGSVVVLCGNYEFNVICYNMLKEGGGYLWLYMIKNMY